MGVSFQLKFFCKTSDRLARWAHPSF
jgi:hypothetical protein